MNAVNFHRKKSNEKKTAASVMISIWLDNYDDLFSDFDPRPYSERTLSDDFIREARKVAKEHHNTSNLILQLLLPEKERKDQQEAGIIKRLHYHFNNSMEQLLQERKQINIRGVIYTITGIILMTIASYISYLQAQQYYIHLVLILFEPAGWFLLWLGLDHLVYFSKRTRKELDFYRKMARAKIEFGKY